MADIFKGTPYQFAAWALNWQGSNPHQRLSLWPDTFAGDLPDRSANEVTAYIHEIVIWGLVTAVSVSGGRCELRLVEAEHKRGANIWKRCLVDLLRAGLLDDTDKPAQDEHDEDAPRKGAPRRSQRLPSRAADARAWRVTWEAIAPLVADGKKIPAIQTWLNRNQPHLWASEETLRKIIAWGEAGAET